jgi:uncharacterized tellurite resistance protein B-like protein
MTDSPGPESRFYIEVLKLLLQVITSDDHVAPEELTHFSTVARRWNVPASEADVLIERLKQGQPLPAPDMGLLRARAQDVIEAARALVGSDQHVDAAEIDMLMQIRELLGI